MSRKTQKTTSLDPQKLPTHVAIIMDGNRRWAARRGLGPVEGHRQAAQKAIEPIVNRAIKLGIAYLTFWAFSSENWKRDKAELRGLFQVFREGLQQDILKLSQKGVRLRVIGDLSKFPKDIAQKASQAVEKTAKNNTITVSFALNYGGREEILQAAKKMLAEGVDPKRLDEKKFSSYLDTTGLPDPDLIIRTGGELRLSGYFPWQSVYSELYFTRTLWPDFTPAKFDLALASFQKRNRRFGGGRFADYKQ